MGIDLYLVEAGDAGYRHGYLNGRDLEYGEKLTVERGGDNGT